MLPESITWVQFLPPFLVCVCVFLSLVMMPGPQVAEQEDQAVSARIQSTGEESQNILNNRLKKVMTEILPQ